MNHPDAINTPFRSPASQVTAVFLLLCLLAITAHFSGNTSAFTASSSSNSSLFSWQGDLSLAQPGGWSLSATEQERSEPPKMGGTDYLASFPDIDFVNAQQVLTAHPLVLLQFVTATFYPSQAPPLPVLS